MGEGLMSPMKQAQAWDRLRRSAIGLRNELICDGWISLPDNEPGFDLVSSLLSFDQRVPVISEPTKVKRFCTATVYERWTYPGPLIVAIVSSTMLNLSSPGALVWTRAAIESALARRTELALLSLVGLELEKLEAEKVTAQRVHACEPLARVLNFLECSSSFLIDRADWVNARAIRPYQACLILRCLLNPSALMVVTSDPDEPFS